MCKKMILLKLIAGANKINPDIQKEKNVKSSAGKRTRWKFLFFMKRVSASKFLLFLVIRRLVTLQGHGIDTQRRFYQCYVSIIHLGLRVFY